jgi:hypothetical protein
MRNLARYLFIAAVLGLVAFGCSREPILPQAPAPEISGLRTSAVVFTETLGDITIPVASGTGVVVGGVGTRTTQPATISINVPGTVKQVLLFWEGNNPTAVGDDQITVEGNAVTGTLVGGPTYFYSNVYTTTYRADITGLGVAASGANSIEVSGMDYAKNNGAGLVVIYDDGSTPAQLGVKEGNDCAYYLFAPPLDTTVPQTFTFTAGTVAREATLAVLASSVEENRPNIIRVSVGSVVTDLVDPLQNSGGSKYDAYMTTVTIPAGATELTMQCLSAKDPSSALTGDIASLIWNCAALSVPVELCSLGDYVWYDENRDGIQDAVEDGIQGVPVKLYACGETTPLASTTTDADGYYLFSSLQPGDYYVEFTPLVNHVFTMQDQGANDAADSDADATTGKTVCTTLTPGENDLTWDAGMYIPYAELGDRVWLDDNCDGIQDAEENGIAGVTVYLLPCGTMTPIASTTTNATGYYFFTNLLPGEYRVMFVKPADLEFSPQDAGANDAADSDALPTSGITVCTTLAPNEIDHSWDAGLCEIEENLPCRMTGGGNSEAEETIPDRIENGPNLNVFSCGGQAGAPTALQPQPRGEWTHTQKRGPAGSFTFHAGTASAPPETEIDWIACTDPGWCVQARQAPAKQLDFAGVGTFHNMKNVPPSISNFAVVGETFHWFEVNIDDLGEPGRSGHQEPPAEFCDPLGYGRNGGEELADCDCPDFYRIRIYAGPTDESIVIYEAYCYMQGGNFQIHPLTGRDLKDLESQEGKGGGHKK